LTQRVCIFCMSTVVHEDRAAAFPPTRSTMHLANTPNSRVNNYSYTRTYRLVVAGGGGGASYGSGCVNGGAGGGNTGQTGVNYTNSVNGVWYASYANYHNDLGGTGGGQTAGGAGHTGRNENSYPYTSTSGTLGQGGNGSYFSGGGGGGYYGGGGGVSLFCMCVCVCAISMYHSFHSHELLVAQTHARRTNTQKNTNASFFSLMNAKRTYTCVHINTQNRCVLCCRRRWFELRQALL